MDIFDKYVGQILDRRYKIVKIIGMGGMAVVFEAIDTVSKRTVAVKMLKDDIANDAQSVKRFINESKAVSMLSHPNIVSIYDVSVKENTKYIVMEYIDGITLKNYMNKKGPLSLREILNYTEQILKALEHAHTKGIIHRDIKPQNIMLLKNGKIKVADFGIAKLPNAETVTMTDKAIGTVYYISPEQASGKNIDPRSDLYSLGVVLYEMATGQLPFMADSPVSVALMQVSTQPKRPRDINPAIPIGLEQIILAAMEKVSDKRIQSASIMQKHLAQLKSNPDFIFRSKKAAAENQSSQANQAPKNQLQPRKQNYPQQQQQQQQQQQYQNQIKPHNFLAKPKNISDNYQRVHHIDVRKNNNPNIRRKKSSHSMLPIIAGVFSAFFIVICVSGVFALNMILNGDDSKEAQTIDIPKFVDLIYNDTLMYEFESLDYYNVIPTFIYDSNYEPGTIISQEPQPGDKRKVLAGQQYCDLKLTISQGAQTVVLPDFTVLEYRFVENELRNMGLTGTQEYEYNETIPLGYVIRTSPSSRTVLKTGDTVKLYISRGPEISITPVPDFVGMTEEKALSTLLTNDLELGSVTYETSDIYEAGRVIFQSLTAYSEVPKFSTKINFIVSLGKK